jgi:hypothetical protein
MAQEPRRLSCGACHLLDAAEDQLLRAYAKAIAVLQLRITTPQRDAVQLDAVAAAKVIDDGFVSIENDARVLA